MDVLVMRDKVTKWERVRRSDDTFRSSRGTKEVWDAVDKKSRRERHPASSWWTQTDTHALVLLSLKDNWSCLLLNDTPLLSPLSFSFSYSLSISPHLLNTLPHQLFSSRTEMTPQGNLVLILRVRVWVYTHTRNAYVLFLAVLNSANSANWLYIQLYCLCILKLVKYFNLFIILLIFYQTISVYWRWQSYVKM